MAKKKTLQDYLSDLDNTDPQIKIKALRKLSKFGSAGSDVISRITHLLSDDRWKVRVWAARYFRYIGPLDSRAEVAVPYLIKALDDKMATVRSEAAAALSYIGEKSSPAIPMLEKTLHDPMPSVRNASRLALDKIKISKQAKLGNKLFVEWDETWVLKDEYFKRQPSIKEQKAIKIFEKVAAENPSVRVGKYHFTDDAFRGDVAAFFDGEFYRFFSIRDDLGAYDGIPEYFTDPNFTPRRAGGYFFRESEYEALKQKAIKIFEKVAAENPSVKVGKYYFRDDAIRELVATFIDGEFYTFMRIIEA